MRPIMLKTTWASLVETLNMRKRRGELVMVDLRLSMRDGYVRYSTLAWNDLRCVIKQIQVEVVFSKKTALFL